jgi:hypothetical protein
MDIRNEDISLQKFGFSLGIVFVGFAAVFGIANFTSVRYISTDMQLILHSSFLIMITGCTLLLLNILTHGFSLIDILKSYRSQIIHLSERFFDIGVLSVFFGLCVILPASIFCMNISSYSGNTYLKAIISIFPTSLWSFFVLKIFLSDIEQLSVAIHIRYLQKKNITNMGKRRTV